MGRDADGKITNPIVLARAEAEEKQQSEGPKLPIKKYSVSYPFKICRKNPLKEITRGEISKQNTNRNKWNRKYCENRHRKNNKTKIYFRSTISDRENKAGTHTANEQ